MELVYLVSEIVQGIEYHPIVWFFLQTIKSFPTVGPQDSQTCSQSLHISPNHSITSSNHFLLYPTNPRDIISLSVFLHQLFLDVKTWHTCSGFCTDSFTERVSKEIQGLHHLICTHKVLHCSSAGGLELNMPSRNQNGELEVRPMG